MHNVMLIWDARGATSSLKSFIRAFDKKSADFQVRLNITQIDCEHDIRAGKIRYGMRPLLDQVHRVSPDIIIAFGAHANVLVKLLKPALKVPVICNSLPDYLDSVVCTSAVIDKYTQKFSEHFKWKASEETLHFIPTMSEKIKFFGKVGVISDDPNGPVLATIIKQYHSSVRSLEKASILLHGYNELEDIDLLVFSSRICHDGRLIHCANACGIPVVFVCNSPISQIVKENYNGWLITTIEDSSLVRCLQHWGRMPKDAKQVLSSYAQEMQSKSNGIHHFFKMIGLKEVPQQLSSNNIDIFHRSA
ncbi:hypothetical protein O1D97_03485 [Marinomonas sp. 15G1-11]|uniref:Uncharacterized protein n=1 Tax=Marinomonas phaeophyticola TaxID=3004091 RepID=A0ABT4JRD9_9GAMM|nr:hypothetical protein [Marinomonas sp. 15G1-11]MCZ2720731.1 hypothetical protein [Marinomonas sp. 15G1-11]